MAEAAVAAEQLGSEEDQLAELAEPGGGFDELLPPPDGSFVAGAWPETRAP